MGVFNYVDIVLICKVCKQQIDDFQTKDDSKIPLIMGRVKPEDVYEFYGYCGCGCVTEIKGDQLCVLGKNDEVIHRGVFKRRSKPFDVSGTFSKKIDRKVKKMFKNMK